MSQLHFVPEQASRPASTATTEEEPQLSRPLEENVRTISEWEQSALDRRSRAARLGDWITAAIGSGPGLLAHLFGFGAWIIINLGWISSLRPLDPFPFPFLTMSVSLEAIFLTLLVLSSQNRLSIQADKRANLNLQVDLLAEREMTAMLQLLMDITKHLGVPATTTDHPADLVQKTDIQGLTAKLETLSNPTNGGNHGPDPSD